MYVAAVTDRRFVDLREYEKEAHHLLSDVLESRVGCQGDVLA